MRTYCLNSYRLEQIECFLLLGVTSGDHRKSGRCISLVWAAASGTDNCTEMAEKAAEEVNSWGIIESLEQPGRQVFILHIVPKNCEEWRPDYVVLFLTLHQHIQSNIALKLPYPKNEKTCPQFIAPDRYSRLICHFSERADSSMRLRNLIIIMLHDYS